MLFAAAPSEIAVGTGSPPPGTDAEATGDPAALGAPDGTVELGVVKTAPPPPAPVMLGRRSSDSVPRPVLLVLVRLVSGRDAPPLFA